MHKFIVSLLIVALALFPVAIFASSKNRILTVDQDGNVSSTSALATQAELAAIAQSNNLIRAEQEAVADGYNTAMQLLTFAAQSITTIPTIFMDLEYVGFEAAVTISPDAKCYITGIKRTKELVKVNGLDCDKVTLTFGLTESLQTIQPNIEYSPQLDGTPRAEWDFLSDGFVSSPRPVSGTFTDTNGVNYANLYEIDAFVPIEYSRGFFGVYIPENAAISDGTVMDMPGIRNGLNGDIKWDNITVTCKGGYVVTGNQGE